MVLLKRKLIILTIIVVVLFIGMAILKSPFHAALQISTDEQPAVKLIYEATKSAYAKRWDNLTFNHCKYSNCITRKYESSRLYSEADVLLFEHGVMQRMFSQDDLKKLSSTSQRGNQVWILYTKECPSSDASNIWRSAYVDGYFNASMSFRTDADVYYPYGWVEPLTPTDQLSRIPKSYAPKTKGAFAYVSNCHTNDYERLKVMKELSRYVDVDIYGKCSDKQPCPKRMDLACETEAHKRYRFYLSFENSLCKDYITEKFWGRLSSDSHFIPVAIGGLSMKDYVKLAPKDSFIHADNFSSLHELGVYLKHLMEDDQAYSRYHEWRNHYQIKKSQPDVCKLCELANKKPDMPVRSDLSIWNSKYRYCRKIDYLRLKKITKNNKLL